MSDLLGFKDVDIGNGFKIKSVDSRVNSDFIKQNDKKVFGDAVDLFSSLSEKEKASFNSLGENLKSAYSLQLGVFRFENQIGWHFGQQRQAHQFYMTSSGILPEYRNQGLYQRLLNAITKHLFSIGFLEVMSHHHLTNNPILVAKLKNGFFITGVDMDPRYGMMVVMKKYKHQERTEVLHFRSGLVNSSEILKRLGKHSTNKPA